MGSVQGFTVVWREADTKASLPGVILCAFGKGLGFRRCLLAGVACHWELDRRAHRDESWWGSGKPWCLVVEMMVTKNVWLETWQGWVVVRGGSKLGSMAALVPDTQGIQLEDWLESGHGWVVLCAGSDGKAWLNGSILCLTGKIFSWKIFGWEVGRVDPQCVRDQMSKPSSMAASCALWVARHLLKRSDLGGGGQGRVQGAPRHRSSAASAWPFA